MSGISIGITIDDKALIQKIQSIRQWKTKALKPMAMALVRGTKQRFRSGETPEGLPWKPLNPAYAAIKRGPGILRASQRLMKSITSGISAEGDIEIGTNVVYARIHQLGGVIVPVKAKRLVFQLANRKVFAKKVTIPARPFLGISTDDLRAIHEIIDAVILRQAAKAD